MHLPIPAGWKDEPFYAPLARLSYVKNTEIFLASRTIRTVKPVLKFLHD